MAFRPPKPGDIVQCRFPMDKLPQPGPKERPGLVQDVERFKDGSCDVVVAYGTSQDVDRRYPGEMTVRASEPEAGLGRDTKFDLCSSVKLPYTDEWFAPWEKSPEPRRGRLDFGKPRLKKALHAAVTEARELRAFEVLDLGSGKVRKGKK